MSKLTSILTYATLLILLAYSPRIIERLPTMASADLTPIFENKLNEADEALLFNGYYEDLLVGNNFSSQLWTTEEDNQEGNSRTLRSTGIRISDPDSDLVSLLPNQSINFKGALLETNEFGMRDQSYPLVKPADTYRIALLGGSAEMGTGVGNQSTFENLTEVALNELAQAGKSKKVEILNFSISGMKMPNQVSTAEKVIPMFKPDMVIYALHSGEIMRGMKQFSETFSRDPELIDPELLEIGQRIGIQQTDSHPKKVRLLEPHQEALASWALNRVKESCKIGGAEPVVVYVPVLGSRFETESMPDDVFKDIIRRHGFHFIDISPAMDGLSRKEKEELQIAKRDRHPNEKGHQLIADALIEAIQQDSLFRQLLFSTKE